MRASTYLSTVIVMGATVAVAACSAGAVTEAAGVGGSSSGTQSNGTGSLGTGAGTASTSTAGSTSSSTGTASTTSSSTSGAGAGGGATDSKFPFPSVIYGGAELLLAPKVITVTFPGDTLASELDQFGASLTSSAYWKAVSTGYCESASTCIGDGPTGTSVALTTAAGASYTDSSQGGASTLQTYLQGLISSNKVPAPDANTIYALYFPASTTITLDGATSCQVFGGYHNSTTVNGQTVVYAVIPECAPQGGGLSLLQETTISGSHEVVEGSTDPVNGQTTAGFYLDFSQQSSVGWNNMGGGEIGDLCVDFLGLGQDETTENGFTVQRIWSVDNAAAGKNPCVPIPAGEVYFNAFPTVSAVVVDVGKSKTIEVDALADGAMSAWSVTPVDMTDQSGQTTYLSFTMPGSTSTMYGPEVQISSGGKIELTVTMVKDPGQSQDQVGTGVLFSTKGSLASATAGHYWPFIVVTTAEAAKDGITMMKRNAARSLRAFSYSKVGSPFFKAAR